MGFKSEYFTYETHFTRGKLPKLLVQSIAHVWASKRMEPNLTKSAFVTNLLLKMLDTLRTELHDRPGVTPRWGK
jgi:hypothetical protein